MESTADHAGTGTSKPRRAVSFQARRATASALLHYVEKVVHLNGKVSLHGRVPVKYGQGDSVETNTLPFCIESEITREERRLDKLRTADALRYQQSMPLLREQSASAVQLTD
jgi:hypothetical protein